MVLIQAKQPDSRELIYRRIPGLDVIRLLALVLVTWQHAASVLGYYEQTQWRGVSPGQSGVAMFCAISGYLAFMKLPKDIGAWFLRRLQALFPSYWLVTIAAFVLTILVSGKETSLYLFISQMLGLGYFTHGWSLVNVVSWFLSLILLCYLLSVIAWKSSSPKLFWLIISALTILLVLLRIEVDLSRHILAFALGAIFVLTNLKLSIMAISLIFVALPIYGEPQLFYAGAGILVLSLALAGWVPNATIFSRVAHYSYEYFLVHGIFIVGVARYISNPFISMATAIIMAMGCAVFLKLFVDKTRQGLLFRGV